MVKLYAMHFWVILALGLVLNSCLMQWDNPIDPTNPRAIPPNPKSLQVSLIPYQDVSAHRGKIVADARNTTGFRVQFAASSPNDVDMPTDDSWTDLDTLLWPESEFSHLVANADTTRYLYRAAAFNANGMSNWIGPVGTEGSDSVDLFPPSLTFWIEGNPVDSLRIVTTQEILIRIRALDETGVDRVELNGIVMEREGPVSPWFRFSAPLSVFRNKFSAKVVDASAQARETVDSIEVRFDQSNAPVNLELKKGAESMSIHWLHKPWLDMAHYVVLIDNEPVDTLRTLATEQDWIEWSLPQLSSENIHTFAVRLLDSLGKAYEGPNSQITLRSGSQIRQNMVWVAPGAFTDSYGKTASLSRGFYIDTTEVTQALFETVMGYNSAVFTDAKKPVESVSWFDAIRFCNARSKAEGFDTVYEYSQIAGTVIEGLKIHDDRTGYRLPWGDEWELAARAGQDSVPHLWGVAVDHQTVAPYLWYIKNAGLERDTLPYALRMGTQPVATRLANQYGLYDVLGNVSEWTNDYAGPDSLKLDGRTDWKGPATCVGNCLIPDPTTTDDEQQRTVRGGNWAQSLDFQTFSLEFSYGQSVRPRTVGIRTVIQGGAP